MNSVHTPFQSIITKPAWLVRRGHGSFITFEFGDPVLTISQPTMLRTSLDDAPVKTLQRNATIRGQWHLWIYCCRWTCVLDGVELAHNESDDVRVARALRVLDGQALAHVNVTEDSATTFDFDLGCSLRTRPAPPGVYSEPTEQWMLYQPTGDVLTVRSDGRWRSAPGNATEDDRDWLPITPSA